MVNLGLKASLGAFLALLSINSVSTAATISLVPVSASGPHTIMGNKIRLDGGGQRVVLEVRISDWAPEPLRVWQAKIDPATFSNGSGSALILADQECTTHQECFTAFGYPSLCVYPEDVGGHCSPAFIDRTHPEWAHVNEEPLLLTDYHIFSNLDILYFVVVEPPNQTMDDGSPKYGGTLILDVPEDARGTFMVGFYSSTSFMAFDGENVFDTDLVGARLAILTNSVDDCDDANTCTADTLNVDECVNTPDCVSDGECDDSDDCTVDTCSPDGCCEYTPQCTSDNECEAGGECTVGLCSPDGCCFIAPECGLRRLCDDANFCTQDSCDLDGCCVYAPDCEVGSDCDDGNGCTADSCTAEGCCENAPLCASDQDCDDSNSCTLDTCTPEGCCEYQPTTDDDGDGVADDCDVCPGTPPSVAVDGSGRPFGDQDGDCDTDLLDFHRFITASHDLDFYRLLFAGLTGPLP